METSSLELLEYAELKSIIGRQISSNPARRILEELAPSTDVDDLKEAHQETAEAVNLLEDAAGMKNVNIRFSGLPEIDQAIGKGPWCLLHQPLGFA